SNVKLDIWVFDLNDNIRDYGLLHYFIPIHDLNNEIIKDQVVISAHYLDPGEYIVRTDLWYTTYLSYYKNYLEIEFRIH
ncbi:unnamed protein product, partial [marine sediment metagenome]